MVNRPLNLQIDWNGIFNTMIAFVVVVGVTRILSRAISEKPALLPQTIPGEKRILRFATTQLEVDRDKFMKWLETERILLLQAGGYYHGRRKPTLVFLTDDNKIYVPFRRGNIMRLLPVRWEDFTEETVHEAEEHGLRIAGVAMLPQVKRKEFAPYTYKATVECPICEEVIEVSGYDTISRTGILKRHIMRKHAKEQRLLPASKGEPLTLDELKTRYEKALKGVGGYALLKNMGVTWEEIYPLLKEGEGRELIRKGEIMFNPDQWGKIAALRFVKGPKLLPQLTPEYQAYLNALEELRKEYPYPLYTRADLERKLKERGIEKPKEIREQETMDEAEEKAWAEEEESSPLELLPQRWPTLVIDGWRVWLRGAYCDKYRTVKDLETAREKEAARVEKSNPRLAQRLREMPLMEWLRQGGAILRKERIAHNP